MLADIKNTIKQSAVYGISRIAAKSISFILLPLYTAIFTSQSIANINLLESLWQYLFTICLLAFETSIITFCAPEKEKDKVKKTIFIFFVILSFNAALFVSAGYFFSGSISSLLLKDTSLSEVTFYCFLISSFESLLVIPLTIARLHSNAKLYTIITVSNLLINFVIQLYFLVSLNKGFEYIFIAKFAAPGILLVLLVPYILRNIKPYFSGEILKQIFKFSFPLMLASLLAMLLNTVDRYILVDFVTKSQIGIYTIGYSIGSVTNFFIVSPFVLAFNVISWKKFTDENSARFFTKSATYLYFAMTFFSLLISLFIPELIQIFIRNPDLWSSVNIIRIILFSNAVASLYYIIIQSYYFKKRTDIIFYVFTFCLIFNIAANYFFSRYFGIYAAAYISVLSYLLLLVISYNTAKKLYFIKFENFKIIQLSIGYIILTLLAIYVNLDNFWINILIKLLLLALFPFLLFVSGFFEQIEKNYIKGFFLKYLKINN